MDVLIGIFLVVYLTQWMTRQRQNLRLTSVHVLILMYMMWLIFSFALGLRHSSITLTALRQFVGTLLSIGMTFILVDLLREPQQLRRLVLVILIAITLQAVIAIGLYLLPNDAANSILNLLGRIGYPQGNVIRYIEQNPALPERAIGTWIDPNSLAGIVAIAAVMIAPQVFAKQPVLKYRWLTFLALGIVAVALILTFSRSSVLAFVAGLAVIGFARYRRYLPILVLIFAGALLLPPAQEYLYRFVEAFTAQDLSTQMRIGEWTDSLRLISRYPVFGVGFTGTPEIDIYTDVANMYLMMANQIGLVGLTLFLLTMLGVFIYGGVAWGRAKRDEHLDSIHLGYHAALVTGLINAIADLYFFRLEYQGSITWFWMVVALCIASSRLVIQNNPRLQ
jgi:O-antigen ligase